MMAGASGEQPRIASAGAAGAADVSRIATDLVLSDSPPTYRQMDCKTFVEHCVRQAGGQMQYAGSNDMFRNACDRVLPLREAVRLGQLQSGWLLFILASDGGEPAQYKNDGIGNASHVGLYTDMHVTYADGRKAYVEVAHSSQSRGGVVASTLANGWTHAGPAKAIGYGVWGDGVASGDGGPTGAVGQPEDVGGLTGTESGLSAGAAQGTQWAVVTASSVNLRKTPAGEYQLQIPGQARIPIYESRAVGGKQFGRTEYANHNGLYRGWVDMGYVQVVDGDTPGSAYAQQDRYAPGGAPAPGDASAGEDLISMEILLTRETAMRCLQQLRAALEG